MVKYSNKGKGKPSKRRTYKVKFKIEKKVKQHKKRLKKEVKKMQGKGLKYKGQSKTQYLPNTFPFKQQMLDAIRALNPEQHIKKEFNQLDNNEYGLVSIENKPIYFPKPKEIFIKNYVHNLDHVLSATQIVLFVLEARCPQKCIDEDFQKKCYQKGIKIVYIISKSEMIEKNKLSSYIQQIKKRGAVTTFTHDHRGRRQSLQQILSEINNVTQQDASLLVVGKGNTGKHTLILNLLKHCGKYTKYDPLALNLVKLNNNISLIDAPYKLIDNSENPLFSCPNASIQSEQSLQAQQEVLIRKLLLGENSFLTRQQILLHYECQNFADTVEDIIKKIARSLKLFGKGGSTDGARTRQKILTDWFCGKLNDCIRQ